MRASTVMSENLYRLELCSVSRIYPARKGGQTVEALSDISLKIGEGEFVCLLGRSGCGKSTLLGLLAGLDKPSSGCVLWNGKEISGPAPGRMLMFQEAALFPWLNVLENVMFGMNGRPEWSRKERRERARVWLETVGLEKFALFRVYELSGGMRQRVALARALAPEPEILLMDEPFSALDAMTRERLYADIQRIWAGRGTSIVMVTHNVREAVCLGTRIVLMSAEPGRIVDDIKVSLPRPRNMNDVELARMATDVSARLQATLVQSEEGRA